MADWDKFGALVETELAEQRREAVAELLDSVVRTLEARAEGRNEGGDTRVMQAVDRIVQNALADYTRLRPIAEYHEDYGAVLWHHLPISEPPYVGTPEDSHFGHKYYTHWQKLPMPQTDGSELTSQRKRKKPRRLGGHGNQKRNPSA